jgi:D-alanyl-D-alanine carboxypeptidase
MKLITRAIMFCVVSWAPLSQAQEPSRPADTAKAKADATPDSSSASIDNFVQSRIQKRHIPGVSVAIVRDGKLVRANGYGLANVELSVPATERTVYQLASVTKTFTATAVMMLVEEGKLKLDDKITALLRDLPAAWEKVTVSHLLNHTSGIKSYTSTKDFFKHSRKDFSQREILDLVAKEPLEFAPGEKWRYNNSGYFLLGMLIEKVTGKKYGEFLDERIFKPLGMTQTRVNDLHAVIPNRAQGYTWDGKQIRNGEYVSPTQPFSAGMLVSSVADLVKWDAALCTETLLKRSTLEQMWTPTKLTKGEPANYGFGWEVSKVNGHRLVSHGGGIPGFSTYLARFVDDNLSVIVLTNEDGGNAASIARGIAGQVLPALAEKAEEAIADHDEKTTERLKGVIDHALRGEADPELFTTQAQKELVPLIKRQRGDAAEFGALKRFQLVERKATDEGVHLRYRVECEKETLQAFFDLDKAGKVARLGIRPTD